MKLIAIDPGNLISAYIIFDYEKFVICEHDILDNRDLIFGLEKNTLGVFDISVIEGIKGYGFPVGDTIIETCYWIGRFLGTLEKKEKIETFLVPRKTVVTFITGRASGSDRNIRKALIDRFEGCVPKTIKKDLWQALALAVYYSDNRFIEQQQKILDFWE